jgi:ABC-type spermidine/putrescine transport system permease subunit II
MPGMSRKSVPRKKSTIGLARPLSFPNLAVYFNIARLFYVAGLNGTIAGVVLVHAAHGLVIAVWIAAAAFASIDPELELADRNIGASALHTALTVTLPLAMPGVTASTIFVFLESLDEFTGTYFVGVPDVTTLPSSCSRPVSPAITRSRRSPHWCCWFPRSASCC